MVDYHCGISGTINLSTTSAEAVAQSDMAKAMLHHMMLQSEMGLQQRRVMLTDNKSQLYISNGSTPKRSAWQPWRYRHMQALTESGVMEAAHVSTHFNPADIGTKPMRNIKQFAFLRSLFLTTDADVAKEGMTGPRRLDGRTG